LNGYRLHAIASAAENKEEAIRLLYVAATRAADMLILSAGAKKLDNPHGTWMSLLADRFDLLNGRMNGPLPDGYVTPQVRVLTAAPETDIQAKTRRAGVDLAKLADEIEQAVQSEDASTASADAIAPDVSARRRFSISRLAPSLAVGPSLDETDSFAESSPLVKGHAIELGMLTHAVLANLDFRQTDDLALRVRINADKLNLRDAVLREEAQSMVARFVGSHRARDLCQARRMHREVEFLLAWPPEATPPTGRYLQGYLDCLYQDAAGRWHVLDYKTNQTTAANVDAVAAKYEMQMLAYGLAAEQALGEPITGLALHFLRTGQEHCIAWDDSARRRGIQLVSVAIEANCRTGDNQAHVAAGEGKLPAEFIG
jgi:ATP-dependent helicase/nuclease subunit A